MFPNAPVNRKIDNAANLIQVKRMNKPTTNIEGFQFVIHAVEAKTGKTGAKSGVRSWLADQLGITRQTLNNFERRGRGIPQKYVPAICKLLKLEPTDIRPTPVYLPSDVMKRVLARCRRSRKSVEAMITELVQLGLDCQLKD